MDMGMFRVASAEGKGGDNPSGELSGYAQERTREQELSWKLDALAAIGIADKSILQRASGIPKLFISHLGQLIGLPPIVAGEDAAS